MIPAILIIVLFCDQLIVCSRHMSAPTDLKRPGLHFTKNLFQEVFLNPRDKGSTSVGCLYSQKVRKQEDKLRRFEGEDSNSLLNQPGLGLSAKKPSV